MIVERKCPVPECGHNLADGKKYDGTAFLIPKKRAHLLNVLRLTCKKCGREWNEALYAESPQDPRRLTQEATKC